MGVYRSKFANRINYPVRLLSLEGACQYLSCSGDLLEELIALGDMPVIRLGSEPRGKRSLANSGGFIRSPKEVIDMGGATWLDILMSLHPPLLRMRRRR